MIIHLTKEQAYNNTLNHYIKNQILNQNCLLVLCKRQSFTTTRVHEKSLNRSSSVWSTWNFLRQHSKQSVCIIVIPKHCVKNYSSYTSASNKTYKHTVISEWPLASSFPKCNFIASYNVQWQTKSGMLILIPTAKLMVFTSLVCCFRELPIFTIVSQKDHVRVIISLFKPAHVKRMIIIQTNNERPEKLAHQLNLTRAFAVRSHNTGKKRKLQTKRRDIWFHFMAALAHLKDHFS